MTFTPGPWKTEVFGHHLRVTESAHPDDNDDICVLGRCESERNQANAVLIAAAPTLHEALVEIVRKADDRAGMGDLGGSADAYLRAIRDVAIAALAKLAA